MKKTFLIGSISILSFSFACGQQAYTFDIKQHVHKRIVEDGKEDVILRVVGYDGWGKEKKLPFWVLVSWNKILVRPDEYFSVINRARFTHFMDGISLRTILPRANWQYKIETDLILENNYRL